jgi:hypothetical protein
LKFLTKDVNLFVFLEAVENSTTNTEGFGTVNTIILLIVLKVIFDKFYSLEDQGIVSDDEDLKNNETGRDRY